MIQNESIDHGSAFDWGLASRDYAKYRDIYPAGFYDKIIGLGLCVRGQRVLDLGTGTGVLPRNLYRHGALFTGSDISPEQIEQARRLSAEAGMDIDYVVSSAEEISFPSDSLDVATACQCFFYFDPMRLLPRLSNMLKPGGRLAVLYMNWLPGESDITCRSEELVLRYSPDWTGAGYTRPALEPPAWEEDSAFTRTEATGFDLPVTFTRASWNGRMKACRGVGASLPPDQVAAFEREHMALLETHAPEEFSILHHATMEVYENRKS